MLVFENMLDEELDSFVSKYTIDFAIERKQIEDMIIEKNFEILKGNCARVLSNGKSMRLKLIQTKIQIYIL